MNIKINMKMEKKSMQYMDNHKKNVLLYAQKVALRV